MTEVLKAIDIHKTFSYPSKISILSGVNLTLHRGETVAILGRSGEGKSTLLQILGTLDSPTKGKLEIDGEEVTAFNKAEIRNQNIAFIFQSFHLLDDYTALENVLLPASIGRESTKKGSEAYQRGIDLLTRVGLAERIHFNTSLLSGGEKQRVAIARALCNDPDIILADEPTGNLDGMTASQIHKLLLDFAKDEGKAFIVVTHDPALANLCSKQYRLEGGKLKTESPSVAEPQNA